MVTAENFIGDEVAGERLPKDTKRVKSRFLETPRKNTVSFENRNEVGQEEIGKFGQPSSKNALP